MDKELFDQLHQSMKEAVAIAKGEIFPSRVFTVESPDVGRFKLQVHHKKARIKQAFLWCTPSIKISAFLPKPNYSQVTTKARNRPP